MRGPREQDMVDASARIAERLHERRMTMAMLDRPPRRDGVDDPATVGQLEEFRLGPDDGERGIGVLQARVGMPDVPPVGLDPIVPRSQALPWERGQRADCVEHVRLCRGRLAHRFDVPFRTWRGPQADDESFRPMLAQLRLRVRILRA